MNPAKHLSVVPVPSKPSATSGMRPVVKPQLTIVVAGLAPMSVDPETDYTLTDTPPETMFRGLLNVIIPALLFDAVLVATVVHFFG